MAKERLRRTHETLHEVFNRFADPENSSFRVKRVLVVDLRLGDFAQEFFVSNSCRELLRVKGGSFKYWKEMA